MERKVFPVVPPMVEHSLTPLGRTLIEPLGAICAWAEKHLPQLLAIRARSRARKPAKKSDTLRRTG